MIVETHLYLSLSHSRSVSLCLALSRSVSATRRVYRRIQARTGGDRGSPNQLLDQLPLTKLWDQTARCAREREVCCVTSVFIVSTL